MKLNLPAPAAALELDAVMVDLDGTMVNTLGDFAEALNRMLADLQLPAIAPQIIENMVGKGSEHLIRSVLAHVEAPDIDALYPRAWQRYEHHYLTINGQFADVYPGVAEGLQALQSLGLRMACLTTSLCLCPAPAGRQGAGRLFRLRVRWRLLPAQKARPHAVGRNLQGLGQRTRTHADGGRLQQRCPGRPCRWLSGGADDLRLQPRSAHHGGRGQGPSGFAGAACGVMPSVGPHIWQERVRISIFARVICFV